MAKTVRKEAVATSIKLDKDLRKQIQPFLFLRELTFTELVELGLNLYMEKYPLTPEEKEYLKYRKNSAGGRL